MNSAYWNYSRYQTDNFDFLDQIYPKREFTVENGKIALTDNKIFWKTIKLFLSYKSINSDKIHLIENGKLINSKTKTADVLNEFFSNIAKNLKIPEYENLNRNFQKVKDLVLKAILKYKSHIPVLLG